MKKRILFVLVAVVVLVVGVIVFITQQNSRFMLDEEFYVASVDTVSMSEIQQLIDDKKSFLLFVSQPDCRTADDFRIVTQDLIANYPLSVFEISSADFNQDVIENKVRFYPTLMIFKNGKLVDYLESNNDADVAAYTTVGGLKIWLEQNIILKST